MVFEGLQTKGGDNDELQLGSAPLGAPLEGRVWLRNCSTDKHFRQAR